MSIQLITAAQVTRTPGDSGIEGVPGSHYKFSDGTVCYVRSIAGLNSVVGALQTAQASGATLTQCGGSWLTGNGRIGATTGWGNADVCVSSAGIHPSDAGHRVKGQVNAELLLQALTT